MSSLRRLCLLCIIGAQLVPGTAARAASVPEWAKPAVRYLVDAGAVDRDEFRGNKPMARAAFTAIMKKTFGGGYSRRKGNVKAKEVSKALVRALGRSEAAARLAGAASPNGWSPARPRSFGTEIVAREMGLRHDRPTSEDQFEASANEPMSQADVAWAVWKAKTAPGTSGAQALETFEFSNYGKTRREVIEYALSLVGKPYVWAGEWPARTPDGYPYGAQVHGGFDCSGFLWYVLREKETSYKPVDRPYPGWRFPERSSSEMAKATPNDERLTYKKLIPGDVVLFAPNGADSKPSEVYHAGLYLGKGWMVHSSGSRAGPSISSLGPGSWWHDQLIFGRRIIAD
jgi:cell wall-associated NlpC family hydrolase